MDWNKDFNKKPSSNPIEEYIENVLNDPKALGIFLVILLLLFGAFTSFYTVQTDEEAVITRLGKYYTKTGPGLHFKLPFHIDKIHKARTTAIYDERFGTYESESLMLTGDLNVADVEWVVQYKIGNLKDYLFNVLDPKKNIRDISEAVMRRVVGDRSVNEVIIKERSAIEIEAADLTQKILNDYQMGIEIVSVRLQGVNPPERVKKSFNDVVAAKQEQEQAINEAEREYNSIIPEARGKAEQQILKASGYAQAIINRATGDAQKFTKILEEYSRAPEITRTRIYLELVEELLDRLDSVTIVDPSVQGVLPVYSDQRIRGGKK